MMVKRYELSDQQWKRIEPLLLGKPGDPGQTGQNNRLFVDGVLWVLRSGARWQDLPERHGKWKSVHKRFTRWAKAGVWERVFEALTKERDSADLMLDSTIVRAHQQAATGKGGARNQALGRSRGGLTTKIHLATDTYGRPLRMILSAGQAGDTPRAPDLMAGFRPKYVLADKAHDSNAIRDCIAELAASAVIPCTATRKQPIDYDFEIYKERNRVGRCFNKLKHFRRIATRYDRREIYFRAFVLIACAMIWMR